MNCYIIIGLLGDHPEIFRYDDMVAGEQVGKEMMKSSAWKPIYCGTLVDLVRFVETATPILMERGIIGEGEG